LVLPSTQWTETELWRLLEQKGLIADTTRHYVWTWLSDVQTLLAKGGTAPLDFTLHDDEHSFRVAQRMIELLPKHTLDKLSELELGLLLLASYLHDIGMNPRRVIVTQVRDYLFSGVQGDLDPSEAVILQRWLDRERPGAQPPILSGQSESERLSEAEFLTAYFCRHRHNDWSQNFIEAKAKRIEHPPYPAFVHDLIALCKSHHYGLQGLMGDEFNLRIAGAGNKLVNLRYLAAVLRVADVLEFDPERTPEVIIEQRSIRAESLVYWYKDHHIVLALNNDSWKALLTARTNDAWTHRAVLDTAEAIDSELQICAVINDQRAFARGIQLDTIDHYIWPWPRQLARDIAPQPNSFVYIDGAFRPDAKRVISLLAGTQLYQSPLAAIRELLQNAFDAVRQKIALDLLQSSHPENEDVRNAFAMVHRISLSVEETERETWLVCTDSGVGMTRAIIESHLLVSGSRPRPEVVELQRASAQRGVAFKPSAEFGIGVLSYFMIADKMILETRPAIETYSDQEHHSWRFEIYGLNSAGELRPTGGLTKGTVVRLRLKKEIKEVMLGSRIRAYLQNLIVIAPCQVEINLPNLVERLTQDGREIILPCRKLGCTIYGKHETNHPGVIANPRMHHFWIGGRPFTKRFDLS
jgi:hypothetical protein